MASTRRALAVALATVAAAALAASAAAPAGAATPPVRNVFVIVLENKNADVTFGPMSPAPYLAKTLPARGQLLPNYYAITHLSLGNYIALISGQGSNVLTQSDCLVYTNVVPGTPGLDGQSVGQGCVYPRSVPTLAGQLEAKGLRWKGYMEDMGNSATAPKTCRHPALNSRDGTQSAKVGDQYAARHNPFVYFHAITDSPSCARNDVPLTRLPKDLSVASRTANYSFISPNLCNDGHDAPCVDGRPGGLRSANAFLQEWVPKIEASPAYKRGGLLLITFDEAEATPPEGDASACCGQSPFLNTPNNGALILGRGGGRTGAVLLSPFTKPGSVNTTPYNHFSFLRSVEDLFGLGRLGYAARPELRPFGADVFNASPRPGISLTGLRLSRNRFRAARRGRAVLPPPRGQRKKRSHRRRGTPVGTRVRYRLSGVGTVTLRVQRARRGRGRFVGGRCRARTRGNSGRRGCTRFRTLRGKVVRDGKAGVNRVRLSGRWRGRRLRRGRYRLIARAVDRAGQRSQQGRARFRIVRR